MNSVNQTNTDLALLAVLFDRANYDQYKDLINTDPLCVETIELMSAINSYYTKYPEITSIDLASFSSWFLQFYKIKCSKDEAELYRTIFEGLANKLTKPTEIEPILLELHNRAASHKIIEAIHTNNGLEKVENILEQHKITSRFDVKPLEHGIEAIQDVMDFSNGLYWRNDILNRAIHPLNKGVFGCIAGRPGTGKTSFVAGEVTYMAQQLKDDEVILWLNNENISKRIKQRIYCAMLEQPWSLFKDAISKGKQENINKQYMDKMGGIERIEFFDIHGLAPSAIERIIKKYNTKLIVIDMLDHLVPPKLSMSNAFNGAAYFGALYQWVLTIACKYAPVIGTSQIPYLVGEEDNKWPPLDALAQSKTDKQGAVTFQLMIGMWGEDGDRRYLSTPKNKYGEGDSSFRCECMFDKRLSIYREE